MILDTGKNIPEFLETLLYQQCQLVSGKRQVQMFPIGTVELPLPIGLLRYKNKRGIFHYRENEITAIEIEENSSKGQENRFLMLGPYSKVEILNQGGPYLTVTEYTSDNIEVRSAVGNLITMPEQYEYFIKTKEPNNVVIVGQPPERIKQLIRG